LEGCELSTDHLPLSHHKTGIGMKPSSRNFAPGSDEIWKNLQQNSSHQKIQQSNSFKKLKIFSILLTKESNPFFDKLMLEDAWRRTKIFGIGFILFLLIYYFYVRKFYIKK
jgi:hypothetical protein